MRSLAAGFVGSLFFASQPLHAQAQLQDTGFDVQGSSVTSYCYTCPAGSWQFAGGAGLVREGDINWPAPASRSPATIAFIQAIGTLQQAVVATASGPMRVTFWITARGNYPPFGGNQTVLVRVNGVQVGTVQTVSGEPWKAYVSDSFDVVAGSTYTVALVGTAQTDQTSFVDNVRLTSEQSTTTYTYDARGRLVTVQNIGGVAGGSSISYGLDPANNRTSVIVTGAQ